MPSMKQCNNECDLLLTTSFSLPHLLIFHNVDHEAVHFVSQCIRGRDRTISSSSYTPLA